MLMQILQYSFLWSMVGLVGIPLFVIYRQIRAKHASIKNLEKVMARYPEDEVFVEYATAELQHAKKRPFWKWGISTQPNL